MLTSEEATKLIKNIVAEKDLKKRMEKADAMIKILHEVPFEAPWQDLRDVYLKDCLKLGQFEKADSILKRKNLFTANDQKSLLDVVIKIYLGLEDTKQALEWIKDVHFVFGAKSVKHLAIDSEFSVLKNSKTFLKLMGSKQS